MQGDLTLASRSRGDLTFAAASNRRTGSFVVGSHLAFDRSLDSLRLVVDSLGGLFDTHQWSLVSPATVVFDSGGTRLDSLAARSGEGGGWCCMRTFRTRDP